MYLEDVIVLRIISQFGYIKSQADFNIFLGKSSCESSFLVDLVGGVGVFTLV